MHKKVLLLYNEGKSINDVASELGLTCCFVYKALKAKGCVRTKREGIILKRKQISDSLRKSDDSVFDGIGIRESYFLGLFYADGCVCHSNNKHIFSFVSKDEELIYLVRSFFNYSGSTKSCQMSICSKKLFDRLVQLGCIPRKSSCVKPPMISVDLVPSFLMGLFDGDGSLSINKTVNSWKASIGTASKDLFVWLCGYVDKKGLVFSQNERKIRNGLFYQISFCGISAKVFLDMLYDSVNGQVQPLKRKWLKYDLMRNTVFKKGPNYLQWEIELLKSDCSDKQCVCMINSDCRNYGWKRSLAGIRKKRTALLY